jgi:hypothetical protein
MFRRTEIVGSGYKVVKAHGDVRTSSSMLPVKWTKIYDQDRWVYADANSRLFAYANLPPAMKYATDMRNLAGVTTEIWRCDLYKARRARYQVHLGLIEDADRAHQLIEQFWSRKLQRLDAVVCAVPPDSMQAEGIRITELVWSSAWENTTKSE